MNYLSLVASTITLLATLLPVQDEKYEPNIAEASNEASLAIPRFRVPDGMKVEVAAAEPLLANPVAFNIDKDGRVFVCETYRQQKGVEDNRFHMGWLNDDLAAQTVEDRVRMFRKHLSDKADDYTVEHDRIRLLSDSDGDGVFDKSTVFADGFNDIADGTGAGVLHWNGKVYYTCIPKLYSLTDADNDGVADQKDALADGFGVRVAFRGHDMHGLTVGPDGRIYFSIGDRGYNVTTAEGKKLHRPDTGAVFRCEPDGSHLEEFASGFRNPQELAFDDYGNLFTGDNNSDSGDKARWVYIVEGADIGWRMYFQYLEDRGPWNRERMWYPYREDDETTAVQPAYIVPPIINIADGPSGLTYYPGVGLGDRYKGHFFLADFRGTAGNSGIRSFAVKPKGASFELTDSHEFIWSILATDVDFGYDGGIYITDWVNGWEGEGKGRLYRFKDQKNADTAAASAAIMKAGFANRPATELVELLSNPDKRIRQEAQFALAKPENTKLLGTLARNEGEILPRIHAIWALGQLGRQDPTGPTAILMAHLTDENPEIRAQATRTINDICGREVPNAFRIPLRSAFTKLLSDESARVQSFAAIGLGKFAESKDVAALMDLLNRNNDDDPVLRHAAVVGLVHAAASDLDSFVETAKTSSIPVRRAAVVVLRRLKSPLVAEFLDDADWSVVAEAARAIDDEEIDSSQDKLAAMLSRSGLPDAVMRRAMNAAFRNGSVEHAATLANVAASDEHPTAIREEAVAVLAAWNEPPPLDRVNGRWRPLEARKVDGLANAIRPALTGILGSSEPKLRTAGVELASRYGITEVAPMLRSFVMDAKGSPETRGSALKALDALDDANLNAALESSLTSDAIALRHAARSILMRRDPKRGTKLMVTALSDGQPSEQQTAITALATAGGDQAESAIASQFDKLLAGTAVPETHLELLNAAQDLDSKELKAKLKRFEESRSKDDPLANYRESLAGGDADRGRSIFFGRSAASCRRCHKVGDNGGAVGPELSKIARERNREYLLESIVAPNAKIAKGFETVVLLMDSGKTYTGVVKEQDDEMMKLMDANGATITVRKDEIDDQAKGLSGMPSDLIKHLSKSDLRDLVEYLAQQK
ncbi:MAG: PVC-type heme-binding CxxCH protein [Planctomycetaceae bacterium]